jgi:hypothetical protein
MWLMFDVIADFSVKQFLNITTDQAHILAAGMEFGRKLRFLFELIKRSTHPKRDILMESVRKLQTAKRDIITHSYIAANLNSVTFIYRARGEYAAGKLEFSITEFETHVSTMIEAAKKYQDALNEPEDNLVVFANAALSLKKS